LPPLKDRPVGRQRKNRYPSCLENKGNNKKPRSKGLWKVQCQNCLQHGHRTTSPKCPLNGTKKRKSRAKKGPLGRPPGSSKKQKVAEEEMPVAEEESPVAEEEIHAPNNTSQLGLIMAAEIMEADQVNQLGLIMPAEVMETDQVITIAAPSTPPAKKKKAVKKKITPR
ncbi:unnamed protein product, partial [Urochloa humidicola]